MKIRFNPAVLGGLGLSVAFGMTAMPEASLAVEPGRPEMPEVIARLLEMPNVQVGESGFTVKALVETGTMFDPLFIVPDGDSAFYVSDDGEEILQKNVGGHIFWVDMKTAEVKDVAPMKSGPGLGIGQAPKDWGRWVGQLIVLAQKHAGGRGGAYDAHLILAFDPMNNFEPETICELPAAGHTAALIRAAAPSYPDGTSSIGIGAGFGPEGGPFAGKYYAVTNGNNAVYQVDADGKCTPFFLGSEERPTTPFDVSFVPKGKGWGKWEDTMLITTSNGNLFLPEPIVDAAEVTAVDANGKVVGRFAANLTNPGAMAFAPDGFGEYSGDLFVCDSFQVSYPVAQTQQERRDGVVYRFNKEGERHVFLTGLINPYGIRFVGNTMVVTDINGDFLVGRREIPDGYIMTVTKD